MNCPPPSADAWKRLVQYAEKHAIGPVRVTVDRENDAYFVAVSFGFNPWDTVCGDGPTIDEAIDAFFDDVATTGGAPK